MLTLEVTTTQGVPSWSPSQLPLLKAFYITGARLEALYTFLNWNIRYPSKDLLLLKEWGNLKTLTQKMIILS